jgi:hypothetical protein
VISAHPPLQQYVQCLSVIGYAMCVCVCVCVWRMQYRLAWQEQPQGEFVLSVMTSVPSTLPLPIAVPVCVIYMAVIRSV